MPVDGQYFSRYTLGPLTIVPLTPQIGASVAGVDLRAPLPEAARAALGEALRRHAVLFFAAQALTRAQLVALGRGLGTLLVYADAADAHPEVKVFDYGPSQRGREAFWHFDMLPTRRPARAAILQASVVPEVGGDTLFCDLAAVHASLPEPVRARVARAVGRYDLVFERQLARFRGRPEDEVMAIRPDIPLEAIPLIGLPAPRPSSEEQDGDATSDGRDAAHHAVAAGGEAARRRLFVNPSFLVSVDGWSADETRAFLADVRERIARPEFQCRHRWQAGDIAIWDNHACLHYATNNYWPQRRIMERLTLLDLDGLRAQPVAGGQIADSPIADNSTTSATSVAAR